MKKWTIVLCISLTVFSNTYFASLPTERSPAQEAEIIFKGGLQDLLLKLGKLRNSLQSGQSATRVQTAFHESRYAYKRIECLLEYYYPHLIRWVNGPALPFADGENSLGIIPPAGFQVMEEMIFPALQVAARNKLVRETDILIQTMRQILHQQDPFGFQDQFIWDAMRMEVYRIIAQGISGFDAPVSQYSMTEAAFALEGIARIAHLYRTAGADTLQGKIKQARKYLLSHTDFSTFNRVEFIRTYANPVSELLLQVQQGYGLELQVERRVLHPTAPHLLATDFYNPNVYSPNAASDATMEKVELGKKLFFDPLLSGKGNRSCGSCHDPRKAFTDGLAKSLSLHEGVQLPRNAPTLWNAAFSPKQFYDSRAVFMEHQVFDVVHNPDEMNGSLDQTALKMMSDSVYNRLFRAAFTDTPMISTDHIVNAIASYLRSLVSLQSRFDRYFTTDSTALTAEEKHGFNLFMGKAKCGTCHFVPFFNGVAPPHFNEAESEVLGVPETNVKGRSRIDPDPGKFNLYKISILQFAFKTPTLRNIELTAPYMHNGVFPTLEEVIDFYNEGGGAGWGIAPENQTLPRDKLDLKDDEKKALVAFMKALTDTSHARRY